MKILVPLLVITFLGCVTTGSKIVTGERLAPTSPDAIEIYSEPPPSFRTIGRVEARSEVLLSSQAASDRAIRELKKQAAALGATGVILLGPAERTSVRRVTANWSCDEYGDDSEVEEEFMTIEGEAVVVER